MVNGICMNCKGSKLEEFIDLGLQPNGNVFPSLEQIHQEQKHPLTMMGCRQCWQVQIKKSLSVVEMFENHPYITGLNQPVVEHFEQLTKHIVHKFELPPNSLVLDIGANDGTLLAKFRDLNMRVLGIDPSNLTQDLAKSNGITVLQKFWNKESAWAMKQLAIEPDIIMATAVFYHVEDMHGFVEGLNLVMGEHTVFCAQCVYVKDILEKLQFDHFYHEHTLIHAISPLQQLFAQYGMRLIDVEMYPVHGGSFVLYVGREGCQFPSSPKVAEVMAEEKRFGLDDIQTYFDFTKRVEQNKQELITLLKQIKNAGKRVMALGAPLKGNTLLNYFGI